MCIFSYLYTLKSCGSKAVHSNSFTVKDWWKLFAFDKIKINNKVSACQCGFLNCLKYLLNNLLMIFYFSNVERQRTFSFSEFFCYEFFHQRNRGRTQFWARPVKFANATVNFFSFFFFAFGISRVDITYNTTVFCGILSRYSSFFHRSRNCQAIQLWLNQDSPATAKFI